MKIHYKIKVPIGARKTMEAYCNKHNLEAFILNPVGEFNTWLVNCTYPQFTDLLLAVPYENYWL
jgi:hypothetical protein